MLLPAVTGAQTLPVAAQDIQALIDAGEGEAAAAAARRFVRQVTDQTGFGVTNARLTTAPATGFGVFEPRANNQYAINEPVYAYIEVYGFSMTGLTSGANELLFDVSFTLDTMDGQQITDALLPMGEIRLSSFSEPLDAYFHLTYRITGAEGAYSLRTLVTDRASGDSAEFVLPVEFSVPPPAAPGNELDGK